MWFHLHQKHQSSGLSVEGDQHSWHLEGSYKIKVSIWNVLWRRTEGSESGMREQGPGSSTVWQKSPQYFFNQNIFSMRYVLTLLIYLLKWSSEIKLLSGQIVKITVEEKCDQISSCQMLEIALNFSSPPPSFPILWREKEGMDSELGLPMSLEHNPNKKFGGEPL